MYVLMRICWLIHIIFQANLMIAYMWSSHVVPLPNVCWYSNYRWIDGWMNGLVGGWMDAMSVQFLHCLSDSLCFHVGIIFQKIETEDGILVLQLISG